MKKTLIQIAVILLVSSSILNSQTFSALTGAPMYNTNVPAIIEWPTSNYGLGYSHKIYNDDYAGSTYLKIAARHGATTWVDHMTISSNGKIGIGTNQPAVRLSVEGSENQLALGSSTLTAIRLSNQDATNFGNRSEIQFALGQSANQKIAVIAGEYSDYTSGVGGDIVLGTAQGGSISEKMRIKYNGHVSIGNPLLTSSQHFNTALLSVKGKLVAKEVIITQLNWADFVFDKNYELMPLNEVENFYKEHRHLPNIPTTDQIIENGNDLAETDALLLQKIEELTMYIVQQQKEIDRLKNKSDKSN